MPFSSSFVSHPKNTLQSPPTARKSLGSPCLCLYANVLVTIQDDDALSMLSAAPAAPTVATTDAPGFDLESYIARYSGPTKLARLQLVAKHCPRLEAQAFALLAAELRRGVNTDAYRAHSERLAPLFEPGWCDEVDAAARLNLERLEGVVAGARSAMAKEQVRGGGGGDRGSGVLSGRL